MIKQLIKIYFLLIILIPNKVNARNFFIPTQVPINTRSIERVESSLGFGTNIVKMKLEWEDDPFVEDEIETIGKLKIEAKHFGVGKAKKINENFVSDWTFLAGILTVDNITENYQSPRRGSTYVDIKDGRGFDLGIRYLGSYTFKSNKWGESSSINWNVALSYYAVLYTISAKWNYEIAEYDTDQYGVFFRPIIAFQPVFNFDNYLSLIPFIGISISAAFDYQYWTNTTSSLDDNSDTNFRFGLAGMQFHTGFDLAVKVPKTEKHKLVLGGMLGSQLTGDQNDTIELHMFYHIPWEGKLLFID